MMGGSRGAWVVEGAGCPRKTQTVDWVPVEYVNQVCDGRLRGETRLMDFSSGFKQVVTRDNHD